VSRDALLDELAARIAAWLRSRWAGNNPA